MSTAHVFPGSSKWPCLQSVLLQPRPSRCAVSLSDTASASQPLELVDILYLQDAARWSQSPMSIELQYQETGPAAGRVLCMEEGRTLVQRVSSGSCHLLLLENSGRQLQARHWEADVGEMDADLQSQLLYLPHFAKGVVQVLQLPSLSLTDLQLRHQRLITAARVVAKRRFVAVEGCVLDNQGASVQGVAVFDTQLRELFCAAALPDSIGYDFTFTVTDDGQLRILEGSVDTSSNRFRLFGFTSNGDLDFTLKLPAMLQLPWRVRLVKDEVGNDFVCEENDKIRLWTPLLMYQRKQRLDQRQLADAADTVMRTVAPCQI